jgi:predicted dehydrogenase
MRAAVIGLGLGKTHALVYDRRVEIDSIALCDPNRDLCEAVAATLHKPHTIHHTVPDLFAAGEYDIVSVVTPDNMHREHSLAAFEAGAHVVLTKPIATNLADAEAIVAAGQRHGRKLMVAHERRFRPGYARTQQLIREGSLGDLIFLRLDMFQNAEHKFARAPWYASKEAGRTAITGSGIHQVDLLRWLSGREVRDIHALGNATGDIGFHDDKTVIAICMFDNGAIGELAFTYEATPQLGGEHVLAVGSKGMIKDWRFCDREGNQETLHHLGTSADHPYLGLPEAHETGSALSVEAFVDAITRNQPMPVTGEDAIRTLQLGLAIDQARFRGKK